MNLNQLEYFVAAAEALNFTRAAARCYISQTAMTQQIRSLEQTIGVPLFERDSHHVQLTAAGQIYLQEARVILNRTEEAGRMARMASEGGSGELTVGYISGYGQSDFSHILRSFHRSYEGIRLGLTRGNYSSLMNSLVQRECDIVYAIAPYKREFPEITHRYMCSYPIMAVVGAGHPLAGNKSLTYQELAEETFIMMQPAERPKEQMEESLLIYQRGGYLPRIGTVEGEPETLLLMIAAGMGISLLPEYILRRYESDESISIIPMVRQDGSAETQDFEISWREDNANPAVEKMLAMIERIPTGKLTGV